MSKKVLCTVNFVFTPLQQVCETKVFLDGIVHFLCNLVKQRKSILVKDIIFESLISKNLAMLYIHYI